MKTFTFQILSSLLYLGKYIQIVGVFFLIGKLVETRCCCNMINTKYVLCKK